MIEPLFIATERFDSSDGEAWRKYFEWAKIPALTEVVGLDGSLCNPVIAEILDEDWNHIVIADYQSRYFYHLDYLLKRVQSVKRRNILGLYQNPETHIVTAPAKVGFEFLGYELIEEQTHISALTNCSGFPEAFRNEELNSFGLIYNFDRAIEIKRILSEKYPEESHADCEMYAIWRLEENLKHD